MIGRLKGQLLEKQPSTLVVDVQGVGYELEASMNSFYKLPEVGQLVSLFTHFVVREDAQLLYAFVDEQERQLFRTLIKINGVGPKVALGILSGISVADFVSSIQQSDCASLVKVPGVGKKTAERLIVEMKDKLDDLGLATLNTDNSSLATAKNEQVNVKDEAESALIGLGYKSVQASKAVAAAVQVLDVGADTEALIRQALKQIIAG